MALDLARLTDLTAHHGKVARVVVVATKGSVPREVGAAMYVWQDGQDGTIGGGALEFEAANSARQQLKVNSVSLRHVPLGPSLGQCCGGAVSVLTEVFTSEICIELAEMSANGLPFARPMTATANTQPLAVKRLIATARSQGALIQAQSVDGWMIEAFSADLKPLWIYGAGHVGRALVTTLAPLGFDICWVDTGADRFPASMPPNVSPLVATDPARAVAHAPVDARHLILTFSHTIDLEICHAILSHGFREAGLIGSATKWARFRTRLTALGHSDAQIMRITCPIGRPEFGKTPAAIAVGVASELLLEDARATARSKTAKDPAS